MGVLEGKFAVGHGEVFLAFFASAFGVYEEEEGYFLFWSGHLCIHFPDCSNFNDSR